MLTVNRSALYTFWFRHYSRGQFRKHFDRVRVFGSDVLSTANRDEPVIFFANHAYWWDGFWSQLCNEAFFDHNLFIIIEYKQLIRYQFFTRLGAFSIVRENPREAIKTIDYAAECLTQASNKPNGLWIFPQGIIEHVDKRPIRFFNGTAKIAEKVLQKKERICLVPLVTRVEYFGEQKPELWLSFEEPIRLSRDEVISAKDLTEQMQIRVEEALDRLKSKAMTYTYTGSVTLVQGTRSINAWWDEVRKRIGLLVESPK